MNATTNAPLRMQPCGASPGEDRMAGRGSGNGTLKEIKAAINRCLARRGMKRKWDKNGFEG